MICSKISFYPREHREPQTRHLQLIKDIYKVKVQVADTGNTLFQAGAKIVVFKVVVK